MDTLSIPRLYDSRERSWADSFVVVFVAISVPWVNPRAIDTRAILLARSARRRYDRAVNNEMRKCNHDLMQPSLRRRSLNRTVQTSVHPSSVLLQFHRGTVPSRAVR